MVATERSLRLEALEIALQELDRMLEAMKAQNYPHEQINEYVKKRWAVWNEIYQVKK